MEIELLICPNHAFQKLLENWTIYYSSHSRGVNFDMKNSWLPIYLFYLIPISSDFTFNLCSFTCIDLHRTLQLKHWNHATCLQNKGNSGEQVGDGVIPRSQLQCPSEAYTNHQIEIRYAADWEWMRSRWRRQLRFTRLAFVCFGAGSLQWRNDFGRMTWL